MKNIIISAESDLSAYPQKLSDDLPIIHFKLVGVGCNTLKKAENLGKNVCNIVREQQGYFLIGGDSSLLRLALHDLVDRFCDAREQTTGDK